MWYLLHKNIYEYVAPRNPALAIIRPGEHARALSSPAQQPVQMLAAGSDRLDPIVPGLRHEAEAQ